MINRESISFPLKCEIKVDFCKESKKIYLSSPISFAHSSAIRTYVESRNNKIFNPYATSLQIDSDSIVSLIQIIPFQWGHQPHLRMQMIQFWQLVKRCHQTLTEIALEEEREKLK